MLDRVVGLLVHQYLLSRAGFVAESAEKVTISSYVDPDGTRCWYFQAGPVNSQSKESEVANRRSPATRVVIPSNLFEHRLRDMQAAKMPASRLVEYRVSDVLYLAFTRNW